MANIRQKNRRAKTKSVRGPAAAAEFGRERKRLDRKRKDRDVKTHWAHFWDVCPKCGGDMFEQISLGIPYEVCRTCHGIYIDRAEAVLAGRYLEPARWLKAVLSRARKPRTG
jgi:hypothetical protein